MNMKYRFPLLALWLVFFVPACAQVPERVEVAPAPVSPAGTATHVASAPASPPATTSTAPASDATPREAAATTVTGTDEYAAAREAMVR